MIFFILYIISFLIVLILGIKAELMEYYRVSVAGVFITLFIAAVPGINIIVAIGLMFLVGPEIIIYKRKTK